LATATNAEISYVFACIIWLGYFLASFVYKLLNTILRFVIFLIQIHKILTKNTTKFGFDQKKEKRE